jgi:hypothetical protein
VKKKILLSLSTNLAIEKVLFTGQVHDRIAGSYEGQ